MAAKSKQSGGSHIAGIRTESNGFYYICCASDTAAGYKRHIAADTFIPKSLINGCQRQLNGDTYMISDPGRRSSGTAAESVNGNDIRSASGNTACDCRNVMYSGYFYNNKL